MFTTNLDELIHSYGTQPKAEIVASAYEEGRMAYLNGLDWWECPQVSPESMQIKMQPWLAGWMYAKQCAEKENKE